MDEVHSPKSIDVQLKEFVQIFKVIVDDLPMGMTIISPQMEILALNKRMKEWFPSIDVTKKPVCYQSFNVPPRESLCSYCPTAKTLHDGQFHETIAETPAGQRVRNYRIISSPVKDSSGRVIAATEMVEDITEKKQIEKRLTETLDLNLKMISSSEFGMAVYKASGECIFANQALGTMIGAASGQLIQQNFHQIESWTASGLLRLAEETLSMEQPRQGMFHFVTTFKREVWLDCYFSVFTMSGEKHLLLMTNDATGRKQAEESLRNSQEMLRLVLDHMSLGVFWKDTDSRYLGCNRVFARDAGLKSPEEIVGKTDEDLSWRENAAHYKAADREVIESGVPKPDFEEPLTVHGGRTIWVQISKIPLCKADGTVRGVMGVYRDITEQKSAEATLKTSEAKFRSLFDNISSGVAIYEASHDGNDFIFRDFNPAAEKIDNIERENVIGRSVSEIFPGVKEFGLFEVFQRVWRSGIPESHPVSLYRDNRLQVWRENYVCRLTSGEVVAIYEDVTEQKLFEEKIRAAKDYAEQIFKVSPSGILTVDLNRRITSFNRKAEELTGYTAEEVIGKECTVFALEPCEKECGLYAEKISKPITGKECRIRRKDGEIRIVLKNADLLRDKHGKVVGGIENFEDITGRKKMEDALLESEEKFHAISDSAQDAIVMMSDEGKISFWNKAAERIFGYRADEVMGEPVHSLLAPERFRKAHEKAFPHWRETGEGGAIGRTLELAALRKDGTEFPIELSLSAIKLKEKWNAVGVLRDISERKMAEANFLKRTNELERMNKAMVGRELRMLELKREMESLKGKISGMNRTEAKG
ncbi:MAG TPA: PAS domain S-box protein [Candidatus Omnitrophota bacterium]|nr:PAS domain S-box protein [Candidatus Omnitrophota bacterium]